MDGSKLSAFEAELSKEGYEISTKSMDPSMVVAEHSHDFDVRLLVTAGEISITVGGATRRYGVGEQCTLAAGRPHSESVGPEGVSFVVGRRIP